jgi:putative ABC transport system ATP-binding protein
MPLIEASNVQLVGEGNFEVVKPSTLIIYQGMTALVGPSGAGKTNLAWLLHGLQRPTGGQVRHIGITPNEQFVNAPAKPRDIMASLARVTRLESQEDRKRVDYRAKYLGFIGQMPFLNPTLTVEQGIVLPHIARGNRPSTEYLHYLAEKLDVSSKLQAYPITLSGGEQQRVAILAALVHCPKFVTADEPTSALDSLHGQKTLALMNEISTTQSTSFLIVSHDPQIAEHTDHVLRMRDNQLVPTS